MILELKLLPEMEQRLDEEAKRSGLPTNDVVLRVLDQHLPPALDAQRLTAIALLEKWMVEDANLSDQDAASNAEILRQLDADRPSHRKLFGDLAKDGTK